MIGDIADRTPGADKDAILHAVGADRRVGHACLKAGQPQPSPSPQPEPEPPPQPPPQTLP
jgi:hypothetical protein